jgi:tetratricopeptide (TPR) repeat protein
MLLLVLSVRAGAHGPLSEQIAALTIRIQHDRLNAVLYLQRGELLREQGETQASLEDFDRAARLDPRLVSVDLARGKTLLGAGRFAEAGSALDRFLSRQPDHAEALVVRARVWAGLNQYRAAANDYGRAIEVEARLRQPNPDHYVERAHVVASLGGPNRLEALAGLDEGITALGPLASLQLYAIELELGLKRYQGALNRLDSLMAQSARKDTWLARRGEILEQAGRLAEAQQAYTQALAAVASLPASHRQTRATLELEARLKSALAHLQGRVREKSEKIR